jgi:hypothetical protein
MTYTAFHSSWRRTVGNAFGMQCNMSLLDIVARHKIAIYIIQNLITINITMIVRCWNRFWVVIIVLDRTNTLRKWLFRRFDDYRWWLMHTTCNGLKWMLKPYGNCNRPNLLRQRDVWHKPLHASFLLFILIRKSPFSSCVSNSLGKIKSRSQNGDALNVVLIRFISFGIKKEQRFHVKVGFFGIKINLVNNSARNYQVIAILKV